MKYNKECRKCKYLCKQLEGEPLCEFFIKKVSKKRKNPKGEKK